MNASDLVLSPTTRLPVEAVTSTIAVLGKKGSGKTYTSKKLTELMLHSGFQVVILDIVGVWWGLKASADGKSAGFAIPILGGEHADVPLHANAGEATARTIVEAGFSCILDLKLFGKAEAHRFAGPFLETLYKLNRNAMHLVVDEADFYAPQGARMGGPEIVTLGAMDTLVRRGRARGIGISMITQRAQVLNKDVLTSTDILFALRVNHNLDIKAVREWVNTKADPAEAKQMIDELPSLPTGDFYCWAPELDIFRRDHADRCETFDSSATPKPGKARVQPKVLAEIDLQKLGAQIAATVEEQKANDPAALKARIRELEKELAQRPKEAADHSACEQRIQLVSNRYEAALAALKATHERARVLHLRMEEGAEKARQAVEDFGIEFAGLRKMLDPEDLQTSGSSHRPLVIRLQPQRKEITQEPTKAAPNGFTPNAPQQKILDAIATFEAAGVPARPQHIAGFCGTTKRSRGFEENVRQLRSAGMLQSEDGLLRMTAAYGTAGLMTRGMDALEAVLSGPQIQMLRLVRKHGSASTEELANLMNTTMRSRGFEENLRRLRSDELLIGSKDALRVAEWLQ